jgi:hypothetical protein
LFRVQMDHARHQYWVAPRLSGVAPGTGATQDKSTLGPPGEDGPGSERYCVHLCENAMRRTIQSYLGHPHAQQRGVEILSAQETWTRGILPFLFAVRSVRGLPGLAGIAPENVSASPMRGPLAQAYGLLGAPKKERASAAAGFLSRYGRSGDGTFGVELPHQALFVLRAL